MPLRIKVDTFTANPNGSFREAGLPGGDHPSEGAHPTSHRRLAIDPLPDPTPDADRTGHPRREGGRFDPRGTTHPPIGYHVTLRLQDDRPIATSVAGLRTLARVVLEQGETHGLLAFGAADNHIHAELVTDRRTVGAFAHHVETSLHWRLALAAPFEPARVRPLVDQRHAYNTFFYVQRQEARHALEHDPAREGTSLPDLLGLRVRPTTVARRVRAHLPRIRREALLALFAADPCVELEPPPLALLVESACAAFALPDLDARLADTCLARRAVVHAAGPTASTRDLADVLRTGERAVRALRAKPSGPAAVCAVLLQARLRVALAAHGRASTRVRGVHGHSP